MTIKKYILLLAGIGFFIFLNSLGNGFSLDDGFQIVTNSYVQTGQFFYYFSHTIGPYYRPLMFFAYTLIFQLFNLSSFFYHSFQVSLYIVDALLVFLLFQYFSKNNFISFIFALLFIIHPMNEELAAHIANFQDVLYMFFGLTALLISAKQIFKNYSDISAIILLFLSILSKETGILFVFMNIIYIFFFRKTNRLRACIYASFAAIAYFLFRLALVGFIKPTNFNPIPPNTITAAVLNERLLTIPKIIYFYLTTFIYPANLAVQYWVVKSMTLSGFLLPLVFDLTILVCLITSGIYLTKQHKSKSISFWFFFFWFCLGLGLHLNIVPLDFTATDRWFYFPMIGLLGMLMIFFQSWKSGKILTNRLIVVFLLIVFSALSIRTIIRNTNWKNDLTLFKHDLPSMEDVASPQYIYGTALYNNGQYEAAASHLKKASELAPNSYLIWTNLGFAYLYQNKLDKATFCFKEEIKLRQDVNGYKALIIIALLQAKFKEAKKMAQDNLIKWSDDPYLLQMLGLAEYKLGKRNSAINFLQKSLSILQSPATQYYLIQTENNLPIEIKL